MTLHFFRKHTLLSQASLLAWWVLFVIPMINANAVLGDVWINLCTQNGIELVEVGEHTQLDHEQHCPCSDLTIPPFPAVATLTEQPTFAAIRQGQGWISHGLRFLLPEGRAPPVV